MLNWIEVCNEELAQAERYFKRPIYCQFALDKTQGKFPKKRDFAYTDGHTIFFSPKIERAKESRVRGLVRHEICHVLFMQEGTPHSETDADLLALIVFGEPILYDKDLIQNTEEGRAGRPTSLPNPFS